MASAIGSIWVDVALAGCMALLGAVVSWRVYEYLAPLRAGDNQWFQADVGKVWLALTDRYFDHRRTNVHPLFPLIHTTTVYAFRGVLGWDKAFAVAVWTSLWASAWAALCYTVAHLLRFTKAESVLIGILLLGSASALCWISVPETKVLGSVTILLCIVAAVASERRALPDYVVTLVVAAAMSMTITNVVAGLALLVVTRPVRRAVQLAVNAFFVVSLLQVAQGFVFPTARAMTQLSTEPRFLFYHASGTALNKLVVMGLHSMVMPRVQTPMEIESGSPMLSVQLAAPDVSSVVGAIAVGLWVVALAWGAFRLFKDRPASPAVKVVGITLLAQMALHLVYGEETFLYSLHFAPLLVLVSAHVMKSPRQIWGRVLFAALAVAMISSNSQQVARVREALDRIVGYGVHEFPLPADAAPHREMTTAPK